MRHAALRALVALAVGIAAGRTVDLPWWVWLLAAAFGVALWRPTRGFTLLGIVAALAGLYSAASRPKIPDPVIYQKTVIRGVVVAEPILPGDPAVVALQHESSGNIRVWLGDSLATLGYGDVLIARSRIQRFDYPRNPGLPDQNAALLERGLVGQMVLKPGEFAIVGRKWLLSPVRLLVMPLRRHLVRFITRRLQGDEGALFRGLLLGGSKSLSERTRLAFAEAGILHILAVSGLHVGVLLGAILLLLDIAGMRGWARFFGAAALVTVYAVMCGSASAVRAALMATAVLAALPLQRRVQPLGLLAVAAIVLLLLDPSTLFSVSAQLSFAATTGIILTVDKLRALFDTRGDWSQAGWVRQMSLRPGFRGWLFRLLFRRILPAMAVALGATISTMPLLLHHFGRFQPLSFVSSLVTVPVVGLALPLGLLAIVLDPVPGLGTVLVEALRLSLSLLLRLGSAMSAVGWAVAEPGRLSWAGVVWLYCSGLVFSRRPAWRRTGLLILLGGAAVALGGKALAQSRSTVVFFDPGGGDATLLRSRAGIIMLFDAGVDGPGVVRDWLRSGGIHRIDVAVISHPDRDHYGGLLDLDRRVTIGRLVVPTMVGDSAYRRLLETYRNRGTDVRIASRGTTIRFGEFSLCFLWPDTHTRLLFEQGIASSNQVSLVAMALCDSVRLLLSGDMESLERFGQDIRADILKSPHHGSVAGNRDTVLALVRPRKVIVMGRDPTPAGLEARLDSAGIELYNTRRSGGLVLWCGPGGRLAPARRGLTSRLFGEN